MVKFGDPAAAPPFTVECGPITGSGRWVDSRTWAWQMGRELRAGERCVFSMRAGLTTLNGEAVTGKNMYEFFAGGPWPRSVLPKPGGQIEEDQAFVINAGGPLRDATAERNIWCEADGVGNRVPIRLVNESLRHEILSRAHGDFGSSPLVIQCVEQLPADAKMRLVWGAGVEAENGTKSEKEESLTYSVRSPFRATLSCEREKAGAPCSPLSNITVQFSSEIDASWAGQVRLHSNDRDSLLNRRGEPVSAREGVVVAKAADGVWIAPTGGGSDRRKTTREIVFAGPFTENADLRIEIPKGVVDQAGRHLANGDSFPLKFKTGQLPPLAKFPGSFGILELKEGGILPVTLRNVEAKLPTAQLQLPSPHRVADKSLTDDAEVIATMSALAKFETQTRTTKINRDGRNDNYEDPYYAREVSFLKDRPGVSRQEIPKPGGTTEFEVVGIPLGKPGYHVVEIESRALGAALLSSPRLMYVRTAVLVTNMAVHLKLGRDNAMVWVTALDSGKPVPEADVRISACNGKEHWRGKTDSLGRALVDKAIPRTSCGSDAFVFASAHLGEDYSFVRSDWNEGIEPWRFGVETWGEIGDFKIHTVFDRSLFRAGETVSMKHIARSRSSRGFAFPPQETLPDKLTIRHAETGIQFVQVVSWDNQGSAISQWKIPESAKRGRYEVELSGGKRGTSYSGEFNVSDFRLPVFTGSVQGVPNKQVAPTRIPLVTGLSFLNGGAAKGAQVEVSATLRPRWPTYPHYERFSFGVDFDDEAINAFGIERNREHEQLVLDQQPVTLDKAGAARLEVSLPDKPKGPSELYAEMTFTDPNGEIQTIHGNVELWPADVTLGVGVSDWASSKGSGNRVEIVALDTAGKPVADQEVKVVGKRRINYSHRRRILGGFYAYEHHSEYADLGEICRGRTDSRGLLVCEPRVSEPGGIYLLAETRDKGGNVARASRSYWVTGGGDLWFTAGNQDRIDVIPEKRVYKPGETARFQVRTPFREATALIAIEAGGIIETEVRLLSRFNPVVELTVKPEWGPNVFVSVLAVRGRVEQIKWQSFFSWGWREPKAWLSEWWNPQQPTAMVDLAKPAFRLGLAEIGVGTDGFKLQPEVVPDKTSYRPREEAVVRIKVTQPDGKPVPAGSEVAFAAVDQALLELRPNNSWNLLDALLQKRGYEVDTATAQSQVIGKRHFGKKAVPPGGGGGRGPAREVFDTLLAWYPRVKLDATEFKLVAIATSGPNLFGTGSAAVRTRQDLQMISGFPPLVREKDSFQALLTLRNGTNRSMAINVAARVGDKDLERRRIQVEAEGATELTWPIQVPEGIESLTWELEATEENGQARDKMRITQQVAPAVPVTVQQATFARIEGRYELPAAPPANALPGKGGLQISLSPKLSTPPEGLKRFFTEYPYVCLEQKASVAVGLYDQKRWQALVEGLPAYLDADGLARYFPGDGPGSTALTVYLLDLAKIAEMPIPEDMRDRMLNGLTAYVEGRIKSKSWSPYDDSLARKLQALESITRHGRPAARSAAALDVEPMRLTTASAIDWYLVVKRLPDLPQQAAKLKAAEQELRNRLTYTGGRLHFTTEKSDFWWWMMISGDYNAFRLIEAVLDDPQWRDDLPRLVRGAVERQVRGRWYTTVANAWASVALKKFGATFERDDVTGITRVNLAKAAAEFNWKSSPAGTADGPPLALSWPSQDGAPLSIVHEGSGKPWASIQALAAVPVGEAKAFGYKVSRRVTPLQEKAPGKVSRGDLWRVTLAIDADQDMTWVVVSDPIPAGARILGDGDGRDSRIATMDEDRVSRRVWPTFVERTFGFYRAYYEVVPKGHFQIDYTVRINNAGEFALPPTRVEAMYAPDVFGETPNAKVVVGN
jgi:uncharacterized protein YfaS (alpha-2-macroglobulin family)